MSSFSSPLSNSNSNCNKVNMTKHRKDWCFVVLVVLVLLLTIFEYLFESYPFLLVRNTFEDFLINQNFKSIPLNFNKDVMSYTMYNVAIEHMALSTITVIGAARDIEPHIPHVLHQIETLCSLFNGCNVIFTEGNSRDRTKQILKNWAAISSHNRTILTQDTDPDATETEGYFTGTKLPREGRIANARNAALDFMMEHYDSKYVIVIDPDQLGWDMKGLIDSFSYSSWDVVCSHGIHVYGIYRDTYAFRTNSIVTNHHLFGDDHKKYNITKQQQEINKNRVTHDKQVVRDQMASALASSYLSTFRETWRFSSGPLSLRARNNASKIDVNIWEEGIQEKLRFKAGTNHLLEVTSCFGGLAIYKSHVFKSCRYGFRYSIPPYMHDCEHVILHDCMKKTYQAMIFTNPYMKLWYGHNPITIANIMKLIREVYEKYMK